jgi:hypothetical protein
MLPLETKLSGGKLLPQSFIRFQNSRPRWDLETLYAERQRVQNILEEKLGAIGCERENA